jgi:hypothetical protein
MRITENQIRKIIRKSLSKTLLKEQKASNWAEYVEMTAAKGIPNAEEFKNLYQKLTRPESWEANHPWMANYSFEQGQAGDYGDYVDWYMRFNDSAMGKDERGSDRWLSPDQILVLLNSFSEQADLQMKKLEAGEEPDPPETVNKRLRNRLQRQAVRSDARSDKDESNAVFDEAKAELKRKLASGEISREDYRDEISWLKTIRSDEKYATRVQKREDLQKLRQQRRK